MTEPFIPLPQAVAYQAVMNLAQTCQMELAHAQLVTTLALKLFDYLQPLHNLGQRQRDWLGFAGLLHDIGWVEGGISHHKTSMRIILSTSILPFDGKERLVIGSIARYHRKATPSEKHDHFLALAPEERRMVITLSAILRLADGLDRLHQSQVKDISCRVGPRSVRLTCQIESKPRQERLVALDNTEQFEQVFNRKLKISWNLHS